MALFGKRFADCKRAKARPYSSLDLLRLRFANRGQQLQPQLKFLLASLGVIRKFNNRRGARGGSSRIINNHKINFSIDVIVRYSEPKTQRVVIGVDKRNLICPHIVRNCYLMPKLLMANVRSLANKFDQTVARVRYVDPNIAVFTETWISDESVDGYEIEGFKSFHRIRKRDDKAKGGGVSVYIDKSFSCLAVEFPADDSIEVVSLMVRNSLMPREIPWYGLIAVYSPPADRFADKCRNFIAGEIDRLLSINNSAVIFLLGDFNDMKMDFVTRLKDFRQLVLSPTRGDNTLDNCYVNSKLGFDTEIQAPIAGSDHCSVVIVPCGLEVTQNQFKVINYRPRKNSCLIGFASVFSEVDWISLLTPMNCEDATIFFHSFVRVIYQICFPIVTKRIKINNKSWFNQEIAELLKQRNILYKSGSKIEEKNIAMLIKRKITEAKAKESEGLFKLIRSGSFDFFKTLSRCAGIAEKPGFASFPGRSSSQSLDEIADFYYRQGTLYDPIKPQSLPAFCPWSPLEEFSEDAVLKELGSIDPRSPQAPDGIPCFIYSVFADILAKPIAILVNKSLVEAVCPSVWKSSYIVCIPKVKCPKDPSDIRPIVISSVISKIVERRIARVLLPQIIDMLDTRQFGGIPSRSTAQYLIFYIDYVLKSLEEANAGVISIITDFSKAFNTVDHNVFVEKLFLMSPSAAIVQWLVSFVSDRVHVVRGSDDYIGSELIYTNGSPQGSVLGGLIFAITINDIGHSLPVALKFVDDLSILLAYRADVDTGVIQELIDTVVKDSLEARMLINCNKCCFLNHSFVRDQKVFELSFDGERLAQVEVVKILGIYIQRDLKWNSHVEAIIKAANRKFFILYRLRRYNMNIDVMKIAYITFIRPHLEYCSVVWGESLTKIQSQHLEQIQKRAFRIILGELYISYVDACVFLQLPNLQDRRRSILIKFAKSFFESFPQLMPPTMGEGSTRSTRNSGQLRQPKCRTLRYSKSPFPSMVMVLNMKL